MQHSCDGCARIRAMAMHALARWLRTHSRAEASTACAHSCERPDLTRAFVHDGYRTHEIVFDGYHKHAFVSREYRSCPARTRVRWLLLHVGTHA